MQRISCCFHNGAEKCLLQLAQNRVFLPSWFEVTVKTLLLFVRVWNLASKRK